MFRTFSASFLILAAVACGAPASNSDAQAQPTAAAAGVTDAERAAILAFMNTPADARGQVENECGERVTPGFAPVELGGAVGTAVLLVMEGGPNSASCYGDGPGLTLFKRDGAGVSMIYSSRGGALVVLPNSTRGVRDIAHGGPGFEHPLHQWNGTEYVYVRDIPEAQMSENVIYLP